MSVFTIEKLFELLASVNRAKPIFLAKLSPVHDYGFVTFESSSDKTDWVPCTVTESRYPLADNYKISLSPMREGFAVQHYYISDFVSLVNSSNVLVLKQDIPWEKQVPKEDKVQVLTKVSSSLIKKIAGWFKLPNLNR